MKFRKFLIICFLLAIFTLGAVSAEDNSTQDVFQEAAVIDENLLQDEGNSTSDVQELVENVDYNVAVDNLSADMICTVGVKDMPYDASGDISISVDGVEKYNQKVSVGGNALILNDLNLPFDYHDAVITYSGDSKYAGFVRNVTIEPYLDVYVSNYGDYNELTVQTSSKLPDKIKVTVDGKVLFNKKSSSGYVEIELSKYSPGTHNYEVFYAGKSLKKGKFNITNFFVEFSDNIEYGESVTFDIYYADDGYAIFKGKKYPFVAEEDAEGEIYGLHVDISGFDVGENVVEFHDSSAKVSFTKSVFVAPKIMVPTRLWVNGTYDLILNASDNFNDDLYLSGLVNGVFEVKNGYAKVPISNLKIGNYKLNVKCANFSWYYDVSVLDKTPKLIFEEYYSSVIYSWNWLYNWEDTLSYLVAVYDENQYSLTGVTKISDENGDVEVYEGGFYASLPPKWLDIGKHSWTISYEDDVNFKPQSRTIEYEVADHQCYIDNDGVYITLCGESKGKITVCIDDVNKTLNAKGDEDIYQNFFVSCNFKKDEITSVKVVYEAENENESFTYAEDYTLTLPISIYSIFEKWGEESVVEIDLPDDIKNKPIAKIDNKEAKVKKGEFYYEIDISSLGPGKHDIVVEYPGDAKYPAGSANRTINLYAEIDYPMDYVYKYNSKIDLSLALPKNAVGNLTVEIRRDGEDDYIIYDTVQIKNGLASIRLPSDKVGEYEFRAYFTGNCEVKECSDKILIKPTVTAPVITYGTTGEVKVSMDNMENAKLVLYLDDDYGTSAPIAEFDLNKSSVISITKTILNRAKSEMLLAYDQAVSGGYGSTSIYLRPVIYMGNVKFDDLSNIRVKITPKITGFTKAISMYYGESKYISLYVYDIFGKKVAKGETVKIKIGKKTFSAKTDKNGKIKFKIPNTITPGKYSVVISYKNFKLPTKKITVKQVLKLKAVKVKKSAKKLVLTATLKKGKKAIKGKWITFKFNGKTYKKVKTNKKGIAKLTIKKSVLKKLKVGKTVKYQATYLKDIVKKSVKVRK